MHSETAERLRAGEALVAGVLSGTSADGIDVAVARFAGGGGVLRLCETLAFSTEPFAPELHARLAALLADGRTTLREIAVLSRDLGRAFGRAVRAVAERHGLSVDLVGSHGQTVFHHDGDAPARGASLQLGDGDFVAAECGAPVVGDFRQADLAAGGEGAPLSPLADGVLFASAPRPLTVLNLGGMANVTWLAANGEGRAFDTGPANALLDGIARARLARSFDEGGASAARGRADQRLLARLLEHPFFARTPPKSTGRDTFGAAWLERDVCAPAAHLSAEDLLATGVELVARTVADACTRFLPQRPAAIHLAGGGVHNAALVAALRRATGARIASTGELGVDPDAREALVFATLAAAHLAGVPLTRPWATGAPAGLVLGKFCPGRGRRG